MTRLLLIASALVALAGCDSVTEPSEYVDTIFTLQSADLPPGSGITTLTPSTITFAPSGTVSIASCNSCEGTYRWDDNELQVASLGCTEIGCGANLDLGEWLVADRILASDSEGDLVTLVTERGGEIATFVFSAADR